MIYITEQMAENEVKEEMTIMGGDERQRYRFINLDSIKLSQSSKIHLIYGCCPYHDMQQVFGCIIRTIPGALSNAGKSGGSVS